VQRILPPPALDFCTAANEAEQAAIDHSRYFQQAGMRVESAGWAHRPDRTTPHHRQGLSDREWKARQT